MEPILTLTVNPSIDKSCEIDHVVADRKLRCSQPSFEPGGGGLNVSRAIKKLGGESKAVYFCGGPPGEILNHFLAKETIDRETIKIGNWTRENLVVYESATGQQYRFGMPGPEITDNETQKVLDYLQNINFNPAFLVASGSLAPGMPIDFYGQVTRIARTKNIRIIIDTSGDALTSALDEGGIYLIKPNIGEFENIAENRGEIDEDQIIDMARKLIDKKKVSVLVISLGSAGSMLVTKDGCRKIRAPAVSIKSKVGAGDSMVAGITLALAQGKEIEDAARFGVAAGAAAVMTPGTELCRKEDAERLYEKIRSDAHI